MTIHQRRLTYATEFLSGCYQELYKLAHAVLLSKGGRMIGHQLDTDLSGVYAYALPRGITVVIDENGDNRMDIRLAASNLEILVRFRSTLKKELDATYEREKAKFEKKPRAPTKRGVIDFNSADVE